jgi:hypothetical protein
LAQQAGEPMATVLAGSRVCRVSAPCRSGLACHPARGKPVTRHRK